MAKKSLIAKAKRTPKFAVQKYNRCPLCGRPRAFLRQIRHLPHLLSQHGPQGRNPWGHEIQLVGGRQQS